MAKHSTGWCQILTDSLEIWERPPIVAEVDASFSARKNIAIFQQGTPCFMIRAWFFYSLEPHSRVLGLELTLSFAKFAFRTVLKASKRLPPVQWLNRCNSDAHVAMHCTQDLRVAAQKALGRQPSPSSLLAEIFSDRSRIFRQQRLVKHHVSPGYNWSNNYQISAVQLGRVTPKLIKSHRLSRKIHETLPPFSLPGCLGGSSQ